MRRVERERRTMAKDGGTGPLSVRTGAGPSFSALGGGNLRPLDLRSHLLEERARDLFVFGGPLEEDDRGRGLREHVSRRKDRPHLGGDLPDRGSLAALHKDDREIERYQGGVDSDVLRKEGIPGLRQRRL